jgi:adenylate cyclase
MGTEIERKFLLHDASWRSAVSGSRDIIQGYLANTDRGSIRVRLEQDSASLNLKSMTLGITRSEFDYPIPAAEASVILGTLCMQPLIEKTRHHVEFGGCTWEIDEFRGDNAGLVVAELELDHPDQPFTAPPWLGKEVSDDPRYYNVRLVEHPYCNWK